MNERTIFMEALGKDTETQRSAYLDETCGNDPALRQRVDALLQSHGEAGGFLEKSVPERLSGRIDDSEAPGATQGEAPASGGEEKLMFLSPSDKPDSLGRLGHYEVLEIIGRGGMGIVLRAFDEKLHRVVAIKVMAAQLATNANARKRFTREAQAAAAVTHDHLVTIHAVEEGNGLPYLVMQFVSGMSLQQRLNRDGPLQLTEIVRIGLQTAAGLAAAHAHGLIHRDIKPANILLENGVERVKITDFGLARAVADASLTQSGVVAGTPQYMSPEQARGEAVDQRTDLFSLGSVLYAMCTGRPPFRADSNMAVLKRVCDDTPSAIRETNREIPEWLVAIVNKLHAKNPAERFQSAAEVAELLKDHLAHLQHPSVVGPVAGNLTVLSGSGTRTEVSPRRRRRWAMAAAVFLCFAAGLTVIEATGVTSLRATVIRIFTPEGALVVEVDDSGVKAGATGQKESLAPGEVRRFEGHTHPVHSVAFSTDGRHVVTASGNPTHIQPDPPGERDDTVRLWDVKTGKELRRFVGHGREVVGVAISRDGHRILSGANDNTVRLWDAQTGHEIRQFTGHTAGVHTVAFSPDVRYAASAGGNSHAGKGPIVDCEVHLWELESGKELRRFKGHTHMIVSLAFSPDGRHLLTGSLDNSMRLWDVESGKEVRRFDGHTNWVTGVAFSPDGRHALSASFDATVRVWEVATGKEVKHFEVPQRVVSVACSPDGRRVLAGTMEGVMHLWDLQTGKELRRYEGKYVAISPDGRQAASGDNAGTVRLWELPEQVAEAQPFMVLNRKGIEVRKYDTLAEAVQGASAGDTIEIRGNGPFVTKPIRISIELTIRAGDGFRPVINLTTAPITQTEPHYQTSLETVAPLVLEGLEFRLLVPYHGKIYHSAVMAATALRIDNCRFLATNATCFRSHVEIFSPLSIWEVRNCEFLSSGDNVALLEFPTAHRLILKNCVATAPCAVVCGVSESKEPSLQLTHNTFRCRVQAVGFGEYDRGQDFEDAKQKGNALLFKAAGNVFDCDRYFSIYHPPGKFRSPADAERRLAQVVGWKGERNLYSVAGQFLALWTPEKGFYDLATPIKSLSNWRQFWGTDEADSSFTASVRYQGGDILARLDLAPEKLTPEDFRLRPDSAGYKAGKDGKDLGADVDLVGPGPAYERWKKTPEYQKWLKETKQVTKAEASTAEPKAFVVLTGKGVEVRRYDTLAEAVRGAIDGDTIEIRGNGPFVTEAINLKNQSLIIRAGEGYRPVLKLTAEAFEKGLPLLETSAPLVLEGLELQQVRQTIRASGIHSMLISQQAPLWMANCRLFMKDPHQMWLRAHYCPTVELHNCEFFSNGEGFLLVVDKSSKCLVRNCVQAGGNTFGVTSFRPGASEALVRLERNTLATSTWVVHLSVGGSCSPKLWGLAPEHKLVRIKAADNILDAKSALTFTQWPETPPQELWSGIKGLEAESAFRKMIQWDDGRNVFAPGASSIDWLVSGAVEPPHGPKSLASWKKFWGNLDADALEGLVRYQGGNLAGLLASGPEKLTAEQFRLRPDSAGYRAGKDGKDLGADVDLVGPGPAYERWKKTPAYQQWLKDSGQVKK